jgi:hypothetical protein
VSSTADAQRHSSLRGIYGREGAAPAAAQQVIWAEVGPSDAPRITLSLSAAAGTVASGLSDSDHGAAFKSAGRTVGGRGGLLPSRTVKALLLCS